MSFIGVNCNNTGYIPDYATTGSAGVDLRSTEEVIISPKEHVLINTGLRLEIPHGHEGQIRSRSGLALEHSVFVLNSPATIDSDYRGEIKVILMNLGNKPFVVHEYMRIAQMVFCPIVSVVFNVVDDFTETERGTGGFGSSGNM